MICEMGDLESRELLHRQTLGRLGCCENNLPYVLPINYYFDGNSIFVHSLPGRKIRMMRANPRVCLQVDEITDAYNWRSVLAFGSFEELTDPTEREQILSSLFRHLPHLTPVESKIQSSASETIVFRIRLERISGVAEGW